MIVRQPLMWVTPLYILGILLGQAFPSIWYLPIVIFALGGGLALHKKTFAPEVFAILFWIALGGLRMSNSANSSDGYVYTLIQEKAKIENSKLTARLKDAGVQGDALATSSALLLGQKQELSQETRKMYASIGASHLLALSGLHLGILYSLLYLVFIQRLRFSEWRWCWMPPILLCLWGYTFLTGFPISLVRASVMFSVMTIASFMESKIAPLHSLLLSALLILLLAPQDLFSISLQLSFVATFFIIVLYKYIVRTARIKNYLLCLLLLSAVAQLGTTPLSIYYFHTMPLLSSLFSIVLVPLTTLIIYLGITALAVPVAPIVWLLTTIINLQDRAIAFFQSIPYSTIHGLHINIWQVAMAYILLLCAIARLHLRQRDTEFNL